MEKDVDESAWDSNSESKPDADADADADDESVGKVNDKVSQPDDRKNKTQCSKDKITNRNLALVICIEDTLSNSEKEVIGDFNPPLRVARYKNGLRCYSMSTILPWSRSPGSAPERLYRQLFNVE